MSVKTCCIAAVLSCSTTVAIAAPRDATKTLMVTLDVPEKDAPQYLCVLTEYASCTATDRRQCSRSLDRLQTLGIIDSQQAGKEISVHAPGQKSTTELPEALAGALESLARSPERMCMEDHDGCLPRIRFPTHLSHGGQPGHIVCGTPANTAATSSGVARVALLFVYLPDDKDQASLLDIDLEGTDAFLSFANKIDSYSIAAESVGGDYVSSNRVSLGAHSRIVVQLQPRCPMYAVELPARVPDPVTSVDITASAGTTSSCRSGTSETRALQLRIPVADMARVTKLTAHSATSVLEAEWSEAVPPSPLRLGAREFEFSWQPNCLSSSWPATETVDAKHWSSVCPRATLPEAGATCELLPPIDPLRGQLPDGAFFANELDTTCRYRCTVPDGVNSVQLPATIRFDRVRSRDGGDSAETAYSWSDILHYLGEQLTSFTPPSEHRMFIEFLDPLGWRDDKGNSLDEVRIVLPNGVVENIDLTGTSDAGGPPHWIAMPAPSTSCHDRIRVAIFGARLYDERTRSIEGGRVTLDPPYTYASPYHLFVTSGVGVLNEHYPGVWDRFATSLLFGGGFEIYRRTRPSAVELELIGDLTQISIAVREQSSNAIASFPEIPFVRLSARANYEWWIEPKTRVGLGIGGALGFPLFNRDNATIGGLVPSFTFEGNVRRRLRGNGVWGELGLGLRLREEHEIYAPDQLTVPIEKLHVWEPYLGVRIRIRLG